MILWSCGANPDSIKSFFKSVKTIIMIKPIRGSQLKKYPPEGGHTQYYGCQDDCIYTREILLRTRPPTHAL